MRVTIPEIVISHVPNGLAEWKACQKAWRVRGRVSGASLGEYAGLARNGRMHSFETEHTAYGWPEARVALLLEEAGWECWTGVQLFPVGGRPVNSPTKKRITDQVEALLTRCGLPIPREFSRLVDFAPKNPDLVCFHPKRRAWRFCEVKRDERVQPEQINALALLHLLTRAEVAVARLVPEGAARGKRTHEASFTLKGPTG